jgi:type I restriction enzyme S subunit
MWEALAMVDDRKPKEQQGLPEGWKWVRLGEVVERIRNGFVYHFSLMSKEGIPITRIETISKGYIDESKVGYLDFSYYELVKAFKLQYGDILFSHINSFEHVGKTAIYNGKPPFLIHGMNLLLLRAKDNVCHPFFLIFLLKSEEIRKKIRSLSRQAVNQVSINISDLSKLSIPLPPLPEQRKIAQIFETVDNAIEKTEKIIEKYKRIKQGLMQDLLTKGIDEKGNIRSEKTHKFKDSPLGRIPEEWEVVRLGEVGEIIMGQSPPSALVNQEGNGIPFLQGSAEFGAKYPLPKNWIVKPLKLAPKNSILISIRAPVGDLNIADNVYCIGRGLAAIKVNNSKASNFFIWFVLHLFSDRLVKISQGSTFEAIGHNELNNFLIPLPPLSEQKRIAEILSQIDQTIEKEEKYKQKLERLKKGLMEDLLTGKVRVNKLLEGEVNEMA